jgi:hypothetical protein
MNTLEAAGEEPTVDFSELKGMVPFALGGTAITGYLVGESVGLASTAVFPLRKEVATGIYATAQPLTLNPINQPKKTTAEVPIWKFGLPNINSSAVIKFYEFDVSTTLNSLQGDAKLVTDSKDTIVQPFKNLEAQREMTYGVGGAIVAVLVGSLAVKLLTESRREIVERQSSIEMRERELVEHPDDEVLRVSVSKDRRSLRRRRNIRRLLSYAGGATLGILVGGYAWYAAFQYEPEDPYAGKPKPAPAYVVDGSPELKGMTISGRQAENGINAATAGRNYVDSVQATRETERDNIDIAMEPYKSLEAKWHADKNNLIILTFHGPDCDDYFVEIDLSEISKLIDPTETAVTGDISTSNGNSLLEPNCLSDLNNNTRGVRVYVIDNHDNLDETGPAILNDANNWRIAVKGVDTAGRADPRSYPKKGHDPIEGSTPEQTIKLENSAFGSRGREQADLACQIEEQTKVPPVMLAGQAEVNFQALLSGCPLIVISGHGRKPLNKPSFVAYDINGRTVYSLISPTASGEFGDNPLAPQNYSTASQEELVINTKTHKLVGYLELDEHPDGSAKVLHVRLPKPKQLPANVVKFVLNHSPMPPYSIIPQLSSAPEKLSTGQNTAPKHTVGFINHS